MARYIAGADLETTGFRADKGHRIVEACIQLWDVDTRTKVRELNTLINPLREIPADASRVHGIFTEDLVAAPTWDKIAPVAAAMLGKAKVFVAHNVGFDAPFLGEELLRVNQTVPDVELFCTMGNGRWATPNGKNPKLAELAWALSIPYDPAAAHRANYDVDVMMACLWKGVDEGLFTLPI